MNRNLLCKRTWITRGNLMWKRLSTKTLFGICLLTLLISMAFPQSTVLGQAPQVTSVSPLQNELNVRSNTYISATFDIDMDQATINGSTFVVSARSTGFQVGTITYEAATRTAIWEPSEDFDAGELVTVVLTAGIQSSGGTPLDNGYVWSFTIWAAEAPGTFVHTGLAGHFAPFAVFCADFDGDGNIDVAAAIWLEDVVSVYFNNGDGTFSPRSDYPVGERPFSISAADFDGDGDMDLVTANSWSYDVSVLLNNGDGTFASPSNYPGAGWGTTIFPADLDGDGDADLVADWAILLNNGDGTFGPPTTFHHPGGEGSVFSAETDQNGNLDLGKGPVQFYAQSVSAGDLDGDGDLDLAVGFGDLWIYLNNGDGTVIPDSVYPAGGAVSVLLADVDEDGDLDVATTNPGPADVSVLLNNGDGTFGPPSAYPVVDYPYGVTACDLEGDGDLDLAVVSEYYEPPCVLLNNGDGTFGPCSTLIAGEISVVAADLDNDGDMDLATGSRYYSVAAWFNLIPGDCNGDGVIDLRDIVYLLNYLYKQGPAPNPLPAGDANRSGSVDLGDVTHLLNYLFKGGA